MEERSEKTRTYVQRDLEDQISEEYRAQGRKYQRTDTNNSSNMSSSTAPEIVVQDVLDLLKRGYTRLAKDDKGYGSIQQYYNLTPGQIVQLFKHSKLRNKKTIPPIQLNIVDREATPAPIAEGLSRGSFAPVQDVVVTNAGEPAPVVTSREQLFS